MRAVVIKMNKRNKIPDRAGCTPKSCVFAMPPSKKNHFVLEMSLANPWKKSRATEKDI
jgi:hypothetical protein